MMLFHIRAPGDEIHWTEIYVIIAVSAALLEEIRIVGRCRQSINTPSTFIVIFRSVLIITHE
jgi:hypothetical protein